MDEQGDVVGAHLSRLCCEAVGEERERLWQQDLEVYPGRTAYERRAANRPIPVVVLAPVNGQPG